MDGVFYVKAAAFLGAAITMGIGSIGPSLGQGLIGMKALEGMAKFPESASKIRTSMFLSMSIVETIALYALLIAGILCYLGWKTSL